MKKEYIVSLALLFLFFTTVHGQNFIPDSIQDYSSEDKAIYLNKRADEHTDLDSMLVLTNEAIQYASACSCDSLYLASNFNKAYFSISFGKV